MSKKTFTLIELIVVIAIIAVLAAVIAPQALKAIEKAQMAKLGVDFKTIRTALTTLATDVGDFPRSWDHPCIGDTDLLRPVVYNATDGWDGPYIDTVPRVPFCGGGNACFVYDSHPVGVGCWPPLWVGTVINIDWTLCGFAEGDTALNDKIDCYLDDCNGAENGQFRYDWYGNLVFIAFNECDF